MPGHLRIGLRLLGLVLLLISAACMLLILWPGPTAVAEAMGVSCRNDRSGPSYQCTTFDAVSVMWTAFWVSLVLGFALRVTTRPDGKGPMTIDLRRLRG